MSTLKVTAEKLVIHDHPNADALELAQVGMYRAVVGKGQFRTGEYALYIPEQAVLPSDLIEEIGLTGRLAGKAKDRVKAVRLRGELSQGIVCRPATLDGIDWQDAYAHATDFAEALGIEKWVPPIPPSMSGEVVPCADLIRWIDIENLKRYPDIFALGEYVTATEKVHGSACLATYVPGEAGELHVSSKGLGGSSLALVPDSRNLYWRAVNAYGVGEVARDIAAFYAADRVGIFGEVFGAGVQDLGYGADARADATLGYVVFDIALVVDGERRWVPQAEMAAVLGGALPAAPVLYAGPFDPDVLLKVAEGREQITGRESHMREGIVIRPEVERHSGVLGGRAIAKLVSEAYLTRKGGTEYE